ncbi:MAG: hypothetical protein MJ175_04545 [Clostridia bacterium]|nr:hypothetical protein [Clostridia bacterium]
MKNLTRKNRTIFLLTLLSLALSACGGEENSPAMTEAGQSPKETETLTEAEPDNGRSGVKDSLPSDLDFGGAEIRLLARGGDQDTLREFFSEGTNGEIINVAI